MKIQSMFLFVLIMIGFTANADTITFVDKGNDRYLEIRTSANHLYKVRIESWNDTRCVIRNTKGQFEPPPSFNDYDVYEWQDDSGDVYSCGLEIFHYDKNAVRCMMVIRHNGMFMALSEVDCPNTISITPVDLESESITLGELKR